MLYNEKEVELFTHRYGLDSGYHIKLKNGTVHDINDFEIIGFGGILFMDSNRCLTCCDRLNELSDISVGDSGIQYPYHNSVITRSKIGQEIMQEFIKSNKIYADKVDISEALRAQYRGLINKKRGYAARSNILKLIPFHKVPKYIHQKPALWKPVLSDYLSGILQITTIVLTRSKIIYKLLHHMPYKILRKVCQNIFRLSSKTGNQADLFK